MLSNVKDSESTLDVSLMLIKSRKQQIADLASRATEAWFLTLVDMRHRRWLKEDGQRPERTLPTL